MADKIEKVDYNFFNDERKKLKTKYDRNFSKIYDHPSIDQIQMQEKDAFILFNKIFENSSSTIELPKSKN